MKRLGPVLVSAVLAAAFLGPGTVTTAARAGAGYGLALLWALLFSTVACYTLQEASARLTLLTGHTLGRALRLRFAGGLGAAAVLALVLGAVILGCAAYQAGNILGGAAGAALVTGWPRPALVAASALLAGALLWRGRTGPVVAVLSALVALMGAAFVATAIGLAPDAGPLLTGLLVPRAPSGSLLLVLGLVGTTVVPYNLFLGSGLARGAGHGLGATRFGLAVAIGLGGAISMAVVVVGTGVAGGDFDYARLAAVLEQRLGPGAAAFFGLGLFAAGFSSAVTAPLAAAFTARSLFAGSGDREGAGAGDEDDRRWGPRAWRYRAVWLGVLAAGAGFGLSGVRPIPAIIAAQALNGVLLPVVAVFLLLVMNDRRLLGDGVNGAWANALMSAVVATAVLLGLLGLARAASAALGLAVDERLVLAAAGGLTAVLAWPLAGAIRRARRL